MPHIRFFNRKLAFGGFERLEQVKQAIKTIIAKALHCDNDSDFHLKPEEITFEVATVNPHDAPGLFGQHDFIIHVDANICPDRHFDMSKRTYYVVGKLKEIPEFKDRHGGVWIRLLNGSYVEF